MRQGGPLTPSGRALWALAPPLVRATGRVVYSLQIVSRGQVPLGPAVIAANHYSHLDPPLIGAAVDRPVRFLAVDELVGHSVLLDKALDWFGAVPLPRNRIALGALRASLELLASGETIGVFPEGARVRRWGERPARRGAAWLALRAGVPLVPVAITGTDRAFGIENRWRRASVRVVVGPALKGSDPRDLTRSWESWIAEEIG